MPDAHAFGPRDGLAPADAFAALPLDTPRDAWPAIAAALPARRPPRARIRRAWPWLAAAAALVLAVALPLREPGVGRLMPADAGTAPPPTLSTLMAQSRDLEALIAGPHDDRAAGGAATLLRLDLEDRLRAVDAGLDAVPPDDPDLDALLHALWQERVQLLYELAALDGAERWLASQGDAYDLPSRID